jgi:hypothetical protein
MTDKLTELKQEIEQYEASRKRLERDKVLINLELKSLNQKQKATQELIDAYANTEQKEGQSAQP